jgi:hypothetical protein
MRLLIVRCGDLGLYQRFRAQLAADPTVKVITDRRGAERRRESFGHKPDRRRGDRRRDERYVSLALRSAGWVEVGMRTLVSSVRTAVDRVSHEADDYGRQLDLPTVSKTER